MPLSYSWSLSVTSPSGQSGPPSVVGTPKIPAPIVALTQGDLLALFDRILPLAYLDPMKRGSGSGYELYQSYAALFARVSRAIVELSAGSYISTASGGSLSAVTVSLKRSNASAGAVMVKAGTIVSATTSGRDFVLLADVVFLAADLGPKTVSAAAIAQGWDWNVSGQAVSASNETLEGDIDSVKMWIQDPPSGDPSITVENVSDATGGSAPMLDALGRDRGIQRKTGEADDPYRARIARLPDTVTPDAIRRGLAAIWDRFGVGLVEVIETWQLDYQTCYDGPHDDAGGYSGTRFVYDDPRAATPFRGRWLDALDQLGGLIVIVPNLAACQDHGLCYDDPADTVAGRTSASTGGVRTASAFDLPDAPDPSVILPGAIDGSDAVKMAVYGATWDYLQSARAAGVSASMELAGE